MPRVAWSTAGLIAVLLAAAAAPATGAHLLAAGWDLRIEVEGFEEPIPAGESRETPLRAMVSLRGTTTCIFSSPFLFWLEVQGNAPSNGFTAEIEPSVFAVYVPAGVWNGDLIGYESDWAAGTFTAHVGEPDPLHNNHVFRAKLSFDPDYAPPSCLAAGWEASEEGATVHVEAATD